MKQKKKEEWWESDQNDLDNDIEQFSRTTGGGGCMLASIAVFSSILLIAFLLVF